ncbi:MAG: ribosome biogenesis GTP-binding protein YihA/YsxC [Elusimicrobiota bacterium]
MREPLHGAHFIFAETAHERLPIAEAEVVFIGRSNVGKSSVLNAITNNRTLARVSKTPGATRTINIYEVKPRKWLVDLPGYGYAVGPERERNYWPEMIGRYLLERQSLKCVYLLVDADVGTSKTDVLMGQWLTQKNIPFQIVATKSDKIGREKQIQNRAQIAAQLGLLPEDVLLVSAKKNYGIPILQRDVIKELAV